MKALFSLSLLIALAGCPGTDHPKIAAGENALINCAAQDFIGMLGNVAVALEGDDYNQKLADLSTKDVLRKDAVSCAVKAVNAVITAKPASSPATSSPTPAALHAAAYLADKHFAPEAK